MNDPWQAAELDMMNKGYYLDSISEEKHQEHLWADGLLLYWHQHKKLPDGETLAEVMFDEWDDPVSIAEAEEILQCLTMSASSPSS
jgi:hypothetical protein